MAAAKRWSAATRRASGKVRLEVWLDADVISQLDEQCDDSGWTRADVIRDLITGESEEAAALRPRVRRTKAQSPVSR